MKLKNIERTCARDGSHGLQGQCGASAEHRSDSGVADSPAPQGRAQHKKIFHKNFSPLQISSLSISGIFMKFIKFLNC
ncbi:MAG: hypothetical protein NZ529_06425 [Cytophagaceae bacterium]|nr:hypothetical protein [Cytophagaceae bacterium]MDW8456414.1 hypothetical protein [Cytophagaceae bacterium]